MDTIRAMKIACGTSTPLAENPAACLAAFLAAGEREGMKSLMLLTGEELSCFAYRLAQLVGNSLSGKGRGILPIFPQSSYPPEMLRRGCLAVMVGMDGHFDRTRRTCHIYRCIYDTFHATA